MCAHCPHPAPFHSHRPKTFVGLLGSVTLRRAYYRRGRCGRDFVEAHGEEAVAAVSRCSKDVAVKLAEFHAGGGLDKLPRPDDLPRAIARPGNGDDVCLWAIKHHEELEDADGFEAYVEDPLEYALGLKKLAAGAAEARARRQAALAAPPAAAPPAPPLPRVTEQEAILVGAGILVLIALVIWRRRQRQQGL